MANFKVNYKKFTTIRHNELRYVTENALKTVCKNVAVEPDLEPLTWTKISRADISMRGFRQRKQKVFLDVRVFNHLARSYQTLSLSKMFSSIEKEKNRKYNKRIINIEHCTFTPLIFSVNDGMSRETQTFYSRAAVREIKNWEILNNFMAKKEYIVQFNPIGNVMYLWNTIYN